MSDKMYPLSISELYSYIFNELNKSKSIFGIRKSSFFRPRSNPELGCYRYGKYLETPIGVAAGPHSQLAQNIISAWLVGCRYIELKTVQTLDELEIAKPCIDMPDEGYNCEWSQELKLEQSFDEYLKAYVLIHILKRELRIGSGKKDLGVIFNLSVGYNMAGILNENVQNFFLKMKDCSKQLKVALNELQSVYPYAGQLKIAHTISDNITLSTMHGCPPSEIEKIGMYLINDLGIHTTIKLNPTLNGPKVLREILNDKLGFDEVEVPDVAFEHDLVYLDGVKIIRNLKESAKNCGVDFSVKLTNTLETKNVRNVFDKSNEMMYMSGRPLHVLAVTLASKLRNDFGEELDISFSAGVDAFNVADVLMCKLMPVTVCSDLLKPGGYERIKQYVLNVTTKMKELKVDTIDAFSKVGNVDEYSRKLLTDIRYKKVFHPWKSVKTGRELSYFNCINPPCVDTCPSNQDIPTYMYLTSQGRFLEALEVIRYSNPFPNTTGLTCDHMCEEKCTRQNYDNSLRIRDIKRFVSSLEDRIIPPSKIDKIGKSVAIVGGGPTGLSCAYYLAKSGFDVEIFESGKKLGGMVTSVIPKFRTGPKLVESDIERILALGVKSSFNVHVDSKKMDQLQRDFDYVVVATGAIGRKKIGIENDKVEGAINYLDFLRRARNGEYDELPEKVIVIGGGNSAIDAARTAKRLVAKNGTVTLAYRRSIKEMPADRIEIEDMRDEGVALLELVYPEKIVEIDGKVSSVEFSKMRLGPFDKSGRRSVDKIQGERVKLPAELVIFAIGQDAIQNLTENRPGVFIGGDYKRGASSIIQGIADGKNVAFEIMRKNGISILNTILENKKISKEDLHCKKINREYGKTISQTSLESRNSFSLVNINMLEQEAIAEASRCLLCDEVCDVCVTVCPNRANVSYKAKYQSYKVPEILIKNSLLSITSWKSFKVGQKNQVYNVGDFCNECGNCATFCPTNGKPYVDKPKKYLSKLGFEAAIGDCFYFDRDFMLAKIDNDLFRVIKKDNKIYDVDCELMVCNVNLEKSVRVDMIRFKKDGVVSAQTIFKLISVFESLPH